jgi:hypothetical protein
MKSWKNSLYAQIIYMAGIGLGLLLAPKMVSGMLPIGSVEEIWVRVLGLLALVLCFYYYSAIRENAIWFAKASYLGRYVFCLGFAVLGYSYELPVLVALAVFEALLATWTWWSLRGA